MTASQKAQWLDRALFVSPYYFTLCTSEAVFHAELRRLKVKREDWPPFTNTTQADATLHELKSPNGGLCAIVCIRVGAEHVGTQIAALLVHEAVHLWQRIRRHVGEAEPSDEFEAYAIQSLSQRLMEEYARQMP